MPALTTLYSIPYSGSIVGLSFAASGQDLALLLATGGGYSREEMDISGSPVLWSDNGSDALGLSPDGTKVAAPNISYDPCGNWWPPPTTDIYVNGVLSGTISGISLGWIDNDHLLADDIGWVGGDLKVTETTIYDSTGKAIKSFPLSSFPVLLWAGAAIDSADNIVYAPGNNTIYSLTDGSLIWQGPDGPRGGSLVGPNVMYVYMNRIYMSAY